MQTLSHFTAGAVALVFLAGSAMPTRAVTFSVDAPSPTVAVAIANEDDLLNPGFGPGGTAVVAIPGSAPPLGGGSGIEVNAFSYGRTGPVGDTVIFSVDRGSIGAPLTAVDGEATGFGGLPGLGDEAADVYTSVVGGFNTQLWDGDGVVAFPPTPGAPSPGLGLFEGFADNVDALDARFFPDASSPFGGSIFWSVDGATAAGAYGGASSADIFISPVVPGYAIPAPPYAGFAALGLAPTDDIDALVYFEDGVFGATAGDVIFFSLLAGSPTLVGLGAGGEDILVTSPGGPLGLAAPGAAIGLTPFDELNALDVVPEPSRALLLIVGGGGRVFAPAAGWLKNSETEKLRN